ncbi:unnamed protein product [Macrosiphum euphorbiae]|uniref:Uncharacterized protein n=1 Tax=Macrosiphum euphorbiae TaxID=13131 RepID=A0AAV0VMF6_9HEMI|nr:unnamed protein product [Macrosiphum euphorbiae]
MRWKWKGYKLIYILGQNSNLVRRKTNCLVFFRSVWGDRLELERCRLEEVFDGEEPDFKFYDSKTTESG